MLEFILLAILGFVVFAGATGTLHLVLMIVFIVLMVLWFVGGIGVFNAPWLTKWRNP
jgi:hypothetical protein